MSRAFHLCMLIIAILIILLLLCLGGCASSQQSSQVIWHDGKCLFFVDGISAHQAGQMSKDWEFDPCEVKVESELGQDQGDPADP